MIGTESFVRLQISTCNPVGEWIAVLIEIWNTKGSSLNGNPSSRVTHLAGRQILQSEKTDLVSGLDFVVVAGIRERQWQQTLFLQVGFVDTRETFDDNRAAAEMSWFQSGVLPRRTFSVVLIANCHPPDAIFLVIAGYVRHTSPLTIQLVLDLVHLAIL